MQQRSAQQNKLLAEKAALLKAKEEKERKEASPVRVKRYDVRFKPPRKGEGQWVPITPPPERKAPRPKKGNAAARRWKPSK